MNEDEIQDVVEEVDGLLKEALEKAESYSSHKEVRPSAVTAFKAVDEARMKLDEIDQREFENV